MKIVIAPDSFKETLSSYEVALAVREGMSRVLKDAEFSIVPISDGGEGILEALTGVVAAGEKETVSKDDDITMSGVSMCSMEVSPPLLENIDSATTIDANFAYIKEKRLIVIESAEAIGLGLVPQAQRNPLRTSSYGLGEIIKYVHTEFVPHKADKIIIGIGGSATVDGGIGMAQALGARFFDAKGNELFRTVEGAGESVLSNVARVDVSQLLNIAEGSIVVASDVNNPLYGERGAAKVFGPQKGADARMVNQLESAMQNYANVLSRDLHLDLEKDINFAGAGAAGGLGAALRVFCRAHIQSGIDLVLDYVDLDKNLQDADLLITGEGKVDGQSAQGKAVFGIIQRAKKYNVPVCVIAGALDTGYEALYEQGVQAIFSSTAISADWEHIKKNAKKNLVGLAESIARMMEIAREKRYNK